MKSHHKPGVKRDRSGEKVNRGYSMKQMILAEHGVILKALEAGTLGIQSPYYGWSANKYRVHFGLIPGGKPFSDTIAMTMENRTIGENQLPEWMRFTTEEV